MKKKIKSCIKPLRIEDIKAIREEKIFEPQ